MMALLSKDPMQYVCNVSNASCLIYLVDIVKSVIVSIIPGNELQVIKTRSSLLLMVDIIAVLGLIKL